MDLVVRTPHGDADVTIVSHGPACTIGDLIAAISGQAVPRVARLDDRAIDCATPLDDAPLLIGSIVTTDPAAPVPRHSDDVELVQIAGRGAGRSHTLSLGRYRIGPGRRLRADELSSATVEESAFEISVATNGVVTVEVAAASERQLGAVCLAGSPVRSTTAWDDGVLTVDNRAFVIDRGPPSDRRRLLPPDPDGTVPFSRSPLRPTTPRLPVIDAVRDATAARPTLWQRRLGQPGAFVVPVGIHEGTAGDAEVVEVNLYTERALAIAGGEAERTALARTILIEVATAHSPADLDVVIATTPNRLAEWDWAKWLPHLRLDEGPLILATTDDLANWANPSADRRKSEATRWVSAHLTLLVIDDPNLWRRRESPLRSLLTSPPAGLRVIALCDDASLAPALCTTLLTESPDRRWRLLSLTQHVDTKGVVGALVESAVAAEVARALAPLTDTELPQIVVEPEGSTPRGSFLDCLGDPPPDDLRRRWADPDINLAEVPFGLDDLVVLDLASRAIIVAASDAREADRVAVTIAATACTRLGPPEMLLLDLIGAPSSVLADFPHTVDGTALEARNAIEPSRLIARIGHLLALDNAPSFVVVVIGAEADRPLRDALLAASSDLPGLCLIVAATDAIDAIDATTMTMITVERRGDRRRAAVFTPNGRIDVLLDDDPPDEAALVLRPLVLGRALTPLEHRIEQQWRSLPSLFVAACRDLAQRAHAASDEVEHPWLVPTPLPSSIDTDALFAEWPGDAVPVGLIDVAATGLQPIWWQPDDGLLVAFGSLRSGVDDLFATVLLGMIDRVAPDDAELVVVDRSPTRRQVIRTIDERHLVVGSDEPDDLAALLEVLEKPRRPDVQPLIVMIDDLGHLRSQAAVNGSLDRLDRALVAAGSVVTGSVAAGSVVAVARTADDAGPLLFAPGRHLIGSLADDEGRLGEATLGPRGRCRVLETGEIVQLAGLDRSLASAIADRLTDPRDGTR
ncbi:MAG TPA: hypothetical protein VES40_14715 [Ilumatobacteraceae bacterium]|nr:hypothetical protein [Ilumatobacteraceae bacterium]